MEDTADLAMVHKTIIDTLVIHFEAIISDLGNHLLNIRYRFDWIYINPKHMIYTLLTTRPATVKISILTILFILLRGQQ